MTDSVELPSTKPYLLRGLFEWCRDNGFTPYIAVIVDERTRVPREHVQDGQIVLNIGDSATNRLQIDNVSISFAARFGGVARDIVIPIDRVSAIYARENGAGMAFEVVDAPSLPTAPVNGPADDVAEDRSGPEADPPGGTSGGNSGRPRLQRIK